MFMVRRQIEKVESCFRAKAESTDRRAIKVVRYELLHLDFSNLVVLVYNHI